MSGFVLPRRDGDTLAEILPSVTAQLCGRTGRLTLPEADRYVVFMVDGLGWRALAAHAADSTFLAPRLAEAIKLTCAVPSTTATSLTTLGCGLLPGSHGIVGYSFRDPDRQKILNALTWEDGPTDVAGFRCAPTVYETLQGVGLLSSCVSLARFASSGLQQTAFAGTRFIGVEQESDPATIIPLVREALVDSSVVYLYERLLDHDGHAHGVGSWQWLDRLGHVEDLVQSVVDSLPDDTALLVTGDHGMVNVPRHRQIVIEEHPGLLGADLVGGEPRFRQLYTDRPEALADAWRGELGERAEVWLRDDAIDAGWFGPVTDRVRPRIGDVLVAMRDDWAVNTTARPKEFGLVGQHGSLTPEEMYVPLFTFGPR
ncbi:MAG: alkaline phosphatase family protein [Arachnia propionica]|uniref:alkaline phosphatase family protein n=1 Tax=Arachnia propionica TaxID=1750 RepID=UPI0026FA4EA6|nr:alkaline phosphatase family protein [Arachnia propionica]